MKKADGNPLSQPNHRDAKDLAEGALVNFLGMAAKISKVLFIFVAAHMYGPTALGIYLLAWSAIDIASKFGLWGIDRSLIRDIARYNIDKSEATKARIFGILRFNLSIAFCLSLLAAVVMFNLSTVIAEKIFKEANLILPLKILSLTLPFVVLTHALIATTKALRIMRYEVLIRQGLEPLVLLIAALSLSSFNLGATGLVIAHMVGSIVAAGGAAFVVFRKYRFLGWHRAPLAREIKMETIRYTSPMAAMDSLNLLVARIDIMLIGYFLNVTSAGYYGIAVEIISVIKRVRQGFEPIFSPMVSEHFYNKNKAQLKRNYIIVTRWLMAGTLLPTLAIALYPTPILFLFSEKATEAATALIILAISHGLFGTFSAAESLLVMTGKSLLNTLLAAGMLVINCAISIPLIPKFGLAGAALGILAAFSFAGAARIYYAYKHHRLHPFGHALLWPLLTASITLVLFYTLKNWLLINSPLETILIFMCLLVFYVGFYFIGATEPEERYLIERLKSKLKRTPAVSGT